MKIVRHDPPPAVTPPPTYDLIGLTHSEMESIVMLCYHSTRIETMLYKDGFLKRGLSEHLNNLYHVLKAEVKHP